MCWHVGWQQRVADVGWQESDGSVGWAGVHELGSVAHVGWQEFMNWGVHGFVGGGGVCEQASWGNACMM